jgi:hypothetical protein
MAGENDFTEWKDGQPVIDSSDGSLDDWKDGEPIALSTADAGEPPGPGSLQPVVFICT